MSSINAKKAIKLVNIRRHQFSTSSSKLTTVLVELTLKFTFVRDKASVC